MPRKPKPPMTAAQILDKIRAAGLARSDVLSDGAVLGMPDDMESLDERVRRILNLTDRRTHNPANMLFFVMYDIESNKVRRLVARYLIRKGCFRIQHSIFLADMPGEQCEEIKSDLADVQAAYDNHDSILVVPISTDYLRAMRVIGKAVDVNVIMHSQNTLFF